VYLTGYTDSPDFPTTTGAYDTIFGSDGTCSVPLCADVFVAQLRLKPSYTITGTVVDSEGQPLLGVQVSAGGAYQDTTNTSGQYTLADLSAGSYTLTPSKAGYFFSPEARTVTVPPSVGGQDFVGVHIRKESAVPTHQAVGHGQPLTYTLRLVYPDAREVALYDAVPTYTTYISGSLSGPVGAVYDAGVISGMVSLAANTPLSLTFAVRVGVSGTVRFSPPIVNRACVYPVGGGLTTASGRTRCGIQPIYGISTCRW